MPRPSKIWPRGNTGWFYCTHNGRKVRLSKDRAEAERMFHELKSQKAEPAKALGPSFRKLADDYLVATKDLKNADAFRLQVAFLKSFCGHVKAVRAADVKGHMVTAWLAAENKRREKAGIKLWGQSTRVMGSQTVKAVINWGIEQGYLTTNPLAGFGVGTYDRRDRVVTPEERQKILAVVTPRFRDFLRVLELTGARPFSEIARLTAADVDFAAGTVTLKRHKTAKKTGKPRVIHLVPAALEIVTRLAARHPTGLLFRNRLGGPWTRTACYIRLRTAAGKTGVSGVTPYTYRHTYITEALIKGVPVEVVAALVGNSPQNIHKFYSHVGKDTAALKAAALKAVG